MRDQFRELNTYRPLTLTIKRNDAAVDLSSLAGSAITLTARRRSDGELLVDHVGMEFVTDGSDGKVRYQFSAPDLDATSAGEYDLQVEITWAVGETEPVVITDTVEVADHFGTHP